MLMREEVKAACRSHSIYPGRSGALRGTGGNPGRRLTGSETHYARTYFAV